MKLYDPCGSKATVEVDITKEDFTLIEKQVRDRLNKKAKEIDNSMHPSKKKNQQSKK
ncbi:MAG: hypothetical protein NC347_00210 [Clostridium sp.]|nr:hypothetical protein [Clostridium sp.]